VFNQIDLHLRGSLRLTASLVLVYLAAVYLMMQWGLPPFLFLTCCALSLLWLIQFIRREVFRTDKLAVVHIKRTPNDHWQLTHKDGTQVIAQCAASSVILKHHLIVTFKTDCSNKRYILWISPYTISPTPENADALRRLCVQHKFNYLNKASKPL